MKCRFCGQELRSVNDTLFAPNGTKCAGNGNKNHVAISSGKICVYCGHETRIVAQKLCTKYGFKCKYSPTGGHTLQ